MRGYEQTPDTLFMSGTRQSTQDTNHCTLRSYASCRDGRRACAVHSVKSQMRARRGRPTCGRGIALRHGTVVDSKHK